MFGAEDINRLSDLDVTSCDIQEKQLRNAETIQEELQDLEEIEVLINLQKRIKLKIHFACDREQIYFRIHPITPPHLFGIIDKEGEIWTCFPSGDCHEIFVHEIIKALRMHVRKTMLKNST